ncbi:MAG TPA: hypothetical protein VFN49_00060 [Candidatus Aquilonibacter sp.]|nr:hypothetical protein [Candidatus Aquilonibacter sp.]
MHAKPPVTATITLQSTFVSGANETGKPGSLPPPDGLLRIPFSIKARLNKHLSATWKQQRIDETYETVTNPSSGAAIPGPSYDDVADTWSLGYAVSKATTISAGYYQRVTSCCPWGANTEHLPFVAFKATYGKKTLGKPLATFNAEFLHSWNHTPAATGDEGGKWLYRTYVEGDVPLRPKLLAVARAGIFSDYFNGQPFPFYYDYVNWGLSAVLSPTLTYSMMVDTLTQHVQGQPFPAPEALHRSKIVLSANVKLPF